MFIFPRRLQCYHLFGCETHANRAITAQNWDYLVYLHNLAVHKDHLPHHRMTSQSALLLWHHLLTLWNVIHDDISGPCASLLILVPKRVGSVPLTHECVDFVQIAHFLKVLNLSESWKVELDSLFKDNGKGNWISIMVYSFSMINWNHWKSTHFHGSLSFSVSKDFWRITVELHI